jgi:NADH-quinone oxidoreductase subunit N
LYYTLVYVLVVLGSFGVILLMSRAGYEADKLDDFKGLYQRDPLLALIMMMLMFSTAGIPPFVGFWAKLRIFQVLWETQHFWLVVISAALSVVGAFYYLRVIKLMYFDPPVGDAPATQRSTGVRVVLAVNAAAALVLGLLPSGLLDLCARLIH